MTHHTPQGLPVQPSYYVQHPDDSYSLADPQPSAQAASVDTVKGAYINKRGNVVLCPIGAESTFPDFASRVYTSAPPSPASVPATDIDEAALARMTTNGAKAWAGEPAQAVDAVDEQLAGELKSYTDDDSMFLTVNVPKVLLLRAAKALQASRQPQTQQGGGENTARAFIEWCKAQPEDRVPVSIDEAMNEFEAALATPQPEPAWSPAYTRGPARQSAPVAAVPALVQLTEEQMISAVRPLCNTGQVAERLVAVSIDEYRAIEAAIAKINGLMVGDGAQPIKDTP